MQPVENNQGRHNPSSARNFFFTGGPILGLAAVFLFFLWQCPAAFHSAGNIKTILLHSVIVSVAALGMTFVIISGGIDLSIGSVVALCMVVTAKVLESAGPNPPGFLLGIGATLCGVTAGAACGLATGLLTTRFRISPFIVTLGMMEIARGLAKWLANSSAIYPPPSWINHLMQQDPSWPWYRLAPGIWVLIVLAIVVHILLRYSLFGRYVLAIGSNEQTARLCGIHVPLHRSLIYMLCGIFAGLAGVLYFGNLSAGDSTEAVGMELQVIAAVVIGGASLSGGSGSALGTILGTLIMVVLSNGCTMLGVPMYVQNLIIGAVIIAAVGLDNLKATRSTTS